MLNPSSQPGNNGHQNDYVFSKASPHPPNPLNYFGQQVLEALPLDVIVFEYIAPQNFRIVAGKHNNKLSHIIPSENAIGKTIREMHDPEHAEYIEKIMLSCIQTGETLRTENSFEIAGQSYWMAATYSAVRNENAEFTHILMAWEDFTERKLKELEAQKQQLEIIEHQAYQLAELSTPLLSISDTTMVMPLIGAIDSHRVQQILDTLLQGTAQTHATTIILDITGVPAAFTKPWKYLPLVAMSAAKRSSIAGAAQSVCKRIITLPLLVGGCWPSCPCHAINCAKTY